MRIVFACLLLAHAFAHLVGFFGAFRLAKQIPYKTTILDGSIDVGDIGVKLMGLMWLAIGLAIAVAGVAALIDTSWWKLLTISTISASFVMCLLEWPAAKFGAGIDLVVLTGVLLGARVAWGG